MVLGQWTQGKRYMKIMPPMLGQPLLSYNSIVDDEADQSILIVQDSSAVYPAYLIMYCN